MALIEVEDLKKNYGSKEALKGISFSVLQGSITAFLGPNGAGKSTTLKILLGLRRPTSGRVQVFGKPPWSAELKTKIGYASQELSFPPHLKVHEVLSFVKNHFEDPEDIATLESRLQLGRLMNQQMGGLSGGEKRRLGLACALLGKPELLILDEPTTGLDLESRQDLWREITAYQKQGGTILLSTHDLHEVSTIAEKILLIDQGQVLFHGAIKEVLSQIELKKVTYTFQKSEEIHFTENSDEFVKKLVQEKPQFTDLRIHHATLEEAFLKIRGRK